MTERNEALTSADELQQESVISSEPEKKSAKRTGRNFDFLPVLKIASIVLMVLIGAGALAFFILAMVSPSTVTDWLLARQVGVYSNSMTSISETIMKAVLSRPFGAVFTDGYIRTMGLFILLLAIPVVCALLNIYFLSCNAQSTKPFKKTTSGYINTAAYCFAAEFLLSTVLFIILKLINRSIPYYISYTMTAIALFSAVLFVLLMVFRTLIYRMKELSADAKRRRGLR